MERLWERARKCISDNARKARWAAWNAQQASTTTAPGGLHLEPLWQTEPSRPPEQQAPLRATATAGPSSQQPPGAQESAVNQDVDLDVDLADCDQLAEPEAKLRAKELDARERALGRREEGLNKVKAMLRRQCDDLGAQKSAFEQAKAQVKALHD